MLFWELFIGNLVIIAIITLGFQIVYSLSRGPVKRREREMEEMQKNSKEAPHG